MYFVIGGRCVQSPCIHTHLGAPTSRQHTLGLSSGLDTSQLFANGWSSNRQEPQEERTDEALPRSGMQQVRARHRQESPKSTRGPVGCKPSGAAYSSPPDEQLPKVWSLSVLLLILVTFSRWCARTCCTPERGKALFAAPAGSQTRRWQNSCEVSGLSPALGPLGERGTRTLRVFVGSVTKVTAVSVDMASPRSPQQQQQYHRQRQHQKTHHQEQRRRTRRQQQHQRTQR